MECLINGYVPTELMIGGQVINGCAKGGEVVYRKKNAGYITNYGDDFITTNDTVYAQIKNLNIYGKTQQDQYYIQTVEDSVVQFDDGVGEYAVVEVRANENLLLLNTSSTYYNGYNGYEIDVANGEKAKYVLTGTYNLTANQQYVLSGNINVVGDYDSSNRVIGMIRLCNIGLNIYIDLYAQNSDRYITYTPTQDMSVAVTAYAIGTNPSATGDFTVTFDSIKLEEVTDINPDGTPTPWIPNVDDGVDMPSFEVTRCGKNLFDKNSVTSGVYLTSLGDIGTNLGWNISEFIKVKENSSYYLNVIQHTSVAYHCFYDSNFNFISSIIVNNIRTLSVPSNCCYIRLSVSSIYITGDSQFQIETGTTTDYEPYNGSIYTLTANTPTQIPLLNGINTFFADTGDNLTVRYLTETETEETTPNADFPQEMTSVEGDLVVKSIGRNLVNIPVGTEVKGNYDVTIQVKPNTTYTISMASSLKSYTSELRAQGWCLQKNIDLETLYFTSIQPICYSGTIGEILTQTKTITTLSDTKYLTIDFGAYYWNPSTREIVNAFVMVGTFDNTDYEPYTGSADTLTLTESLKGIETSTNYNYIDGDGQTWLNDVLDVQNSEIKKNLAEIVFDGTENWEATSDSFIRMHYTLGAKPVTDNNTIAPLFCNLYHNKTANQTYLGEEGVSIDTSGNLKIYSADFTDVISWKAYLAGLYANNTPLRIIYQLNTPTTEQIDTTSLKKLRSYVGLTNLFVDNDAGVQADFRVNYGELITITDNLIQFDNGFTGSYISVTADEDCEVTRCGKNLFDGLEELGGYYDATGEPYTSSSMYRSINYISVPQSQTLAISTSLNIYEYNSNREFIQKNSRQYSPITLSNNTTKIRISKGLSISAVQLEVGTIATDYEEYQGETYTLTAGETVKIPVLNGTNTLFTNSATATLTANYYTYSDNTYAYSNALNELGVNSANTTDQMINQLEDMGVEI